MSKRHKYHGVVLLNGMKVPCKVDAEGYVLLDDFQRDGPPESLNDVISIFDDPESEYYEICSSEVFEREYLEQVARDLDLPISIVDSRVLHDSIAYHKRIIAGK